jgi:hypothetical protein
VPTSINGRVLQLEKDMYHGEGVDNPSMMTRMDRVERAIGTMNKLTWVLIAAILAALGDIVQVHLTHIVK